MKPTALLPILLTTCNALPAQDPTPAPDPLPARVQRFLAAAPASKADLARKILADRPAFAAVFAELRRGRHYAADVPTGRLLRERNGVGGVRHPYMILVPDDYDPARRYPVRFDLHGGMGAKEWRELDGAWSPGWTRAHDQIVVVPAGWWDSMWWQWSQVDNFEAILREVRATWNIDENRVVIYGSSDGGAALFFQAMRTPDRWAGYCGHVAPPDRLVRADFAPDGQMHVSNLDGQTFHLGYGERDRKVPLRHLRRYLERFERAGAELDWYVLKGQGHSLRLPPERERQLARFLWGRRRDPLPDRVSWASERTDRYARRSWLVLDELEPATADHRVDETNLLPRWGTPIQMHGKTQARVPWGRVVASRDGNTVRLTTRRVRRCRLLISPDEFDLSAPIVVVADGRERFRGVVEPSLATLLHWAAIDDDRTKLFAAEIALEIPPR